MIDYRLIRGGSWYDLLRYCRSACRDFHRLVNPNDDVGFRVCCSQGDGHTITLEEQADV